MTAADPSSVRVRRSTTIGLLVGGLAYFGTLLNWSTDLFRTASAPGIWSNLYDVQARAIMAGHLWMPSDVMGIEGIVSDGHTYMYFPPFPALLRIPVLVATTAYDGRLSLVSMGVAWIVLAVMLTRLVWLARRVVSGRDEVSRTEAALGAIVLAAGTGGTVLTYDAGLPWVYHEAYVWAAAVAVGAAYWLARVLVAPDAVAVRWLGLFVLLCVLTRATEGWAMAVVVIGVGAWSLVRRGPASLRPWGRWLVLAGLVPVLVGVLISELKFGTVWLHPLQDQVWTSVNAHRREALAANGGSLTGPQFFLTSLIAYFRPDGIRLVEHFPWITLPAHPAVSYGGAVVDQSYRTGSVTAFMTVLLVLTVVAAVAMLLPGRPPGFRALRWPLVASVLVTGGVMAYGYYSYRYVTDFVPALVVGGAIGAPVVAGWLHGRRRATRVVLPLAAAGTLFAILANVSTGYASYVFTHQGRPLTSYVALQERLTPGATRGLVRRTDAGPGPGRADELVVQGDCEAVWAGTGDSYRRWSPVVVRDHLYTVTLDRRPAGGDYPIVTVPTVPGGQAVLQVATDGRSARVVVNGPDVGAVAPWQPVAPGEQISVRVVADPSYELYRVSVAGVPVGSLPASYHDLDWYYTGVLPRLPRYVDPVPPVSSSGVVVTESLGPVPPLCHRLTD